MFAFQKFHEFSGFSSRSEFRQWDVIPSHFTILLVLWIIGDQLGGKRDILEEGKRLGKRFNVEAIDFE